MRRAVWSGLILIGCLGGAYGFQFWNFTPPEVVPAKVYDRSLRVTDGRAHTVDLDDIDPGGPPRDGIPAMDEPEYENVGSADIYLNDDGYGIDLAWAGKRYFFPEQLLVWHQVVNTTLGRTPLSVTYCPLCALGTVFERRVDDLDLSFGVSGELWNNNLLMFDRQTQTLWSQILGEGVAGELAGTRLKAIPSATSRWRDWKAAHPEGLVLARPNGFERDYTRNPYGKYETNSDMYFSVTRRDERLAPKSVVIGLAVDGAAGAYLLEAVKQEGIINDQIGETPVVLTYDALTQTVHALLGQNGDQLLTMTAADGRMTDAETKSVWTLEGVAVRGPRKGQKLDIIAAPRLFWFCWAAAYPETELHLP